LLKENSFQNLKDAIRFLYENVINLNGTITGEHGIGILKKEFLKMEQDENLLNLQKKIKRIFDPKNILNPGKIL
jgi:FAD/FMN-containing dehydrogenase